VPLDETARPAAPGNQDHQCQPPQVHVVGTIWSYELEPTDAGTRVVESRHAENGVKPISNVAVNAMFGGVPSFEQELIEGMNESLSRLKAAAES
jgi:hypothetical protein